ncbi:MAG: hypothetical protein PHW96_04535 [Candidatus Nanoarchaeia archaeon]|nr:hypothetical protein [Candidatus Nanoarchaeia archaeon]
MQIIHHAVIAVIAILLLYPILGIHSLWIFVTGVLIDIDHYAWYVDKFRKYNLVKHNVFEAYKFFKKKKYKKHHPLLLVFHTYEFGFFLVVLTIIYPFYLPFLIGYLLHMSADMIYDMHKYSYKNRLRSIILTLLKKY